MINALKSRQSEKVRGLDKPVQTPVFPEGEKTGVSLTLADMRAGESARIGCLECEHAVRCERLLAYGLIEGQRILLVQRSPAFVIRVEETELALDAEVARCVRVTRDG